MIMVKINDSELKLFQAHLSNSCGITIPEEKRYLFDTRLVELFDVYKFENFTELYNHMQKTPDLEKRIIELMTTNETSFFRDEHPYQAFIDHLLPAFAAKERNKASFLSPEINILSAACSTGQEPYSLAILCREWLNMNPSFPPMGIKIIAGDISSEALSRAKAGEYTAMEIDKGMRSDYLARYFVQKGKNWQIADQIRKMIDFRNINLAEPFPDFGVNFDIIFCRNVIIYFSAELKKKIINGFKTMLKPQGCLIIGAAENLYGVSNAFEFDHIGKTTIYRVKEEA